MQSIGYAQSCKIEALVGQIEIELTLLKRLLNAPPTNESSLPDIREAVTGLQESMKHLNTLISSSGTKEPRC